MRRALRADCLLKEDYIIYRSRGYTMVPTTLVSLRALILKEPLPKTYVRSYIQTWPEPVFHRLLGPGFATSALTQPTSEKYYCKLLSYTVEKDNVSFRLALTYIFNDSVFLDQP